MVFVFQVFKFIHDFYRVSFSVFLAMHDRCGAEGTFKRTSSAGEHREIFGVLEIVLLTGNGNEIERGAWQLIKIFDLFSFTGHYNRSVIAKCDPMNF